MLRYKFIGLIGCLAYTINFSWAAQLQAITLHDHSLHLIFDEPAAQPLLSSGRHAQEIFIDIPHSSIRSGITEQQLTHQHFKHWSAFATAEATRAIITTHVPLIWEHNQLQNFTLTAQNNTWALTQIAKQTQPASKNITFNAQNIKIRALLDIIADTAGINIVTSDTVAGHITIRLNDVPWQQALQTIMQTQGLAQRKRHNIIYIAPLADITTQENLQRQALAEQRAYASLQTALIQINYAKAQTLAELIGKLYAPQTASGAVIGSSKNTHWGITVDPRTNHLIIRNTAANITGIKGLVEQLDVPVQQVLIESRIVVANNDFTKDLGVRLGVSASHNTGQSGFIGTTGSSSGIDRMVTSFNEQGQAQAPSSAAERHNVSLPAGNPAGALGLAFLGSDFLLDLELSALQAEGAGEVISSPRIVTVDKNEAIIEQGVDVPFFNATADSGAGVQFKKAVLSLKVRPQITPDQRIIMDLEINKDSVGREVSSGLDGGRVPTIDRRQIQTQVLVNNGETIVLGGIYETTQTNAETKVPFLGDLPLLGGLFRSTHETTTQVELLIFVTPQIINQQLRLAQ